MNSLTKSRAIALLTVTVALLAAAMLVTQRTAEANHLQEHRMQLGLASSSIKVSNAAIFHSDSALDLSVVGGSAGLDVQFRAWHVRGNDDLTAERQDYISFHDCSGVSYKVFDASSSQIGRETFVHIDESGSAPSSFTLYAAGWTVKTLGDVSSTQDVDCMDDSIGGNWADGWTGPHLHQGNSYAVPLNTGYFSTSGTYSAYFTADWIRRYEDY